ncbi:ABC transporter permease [Polaromonas sp. JS666]|uniref:ABC transporter permease n=1 Tax=Polaromonas sp. (strain JS666 / ATCC BAA-500) TaxID=296591 RepID=UPI0000463CA5|nr:ABC transporter permease [Polaromonas sp. JS666]ABE42027.1 binding-protein-dependent transport systems inner membrane component [Polaromonas sp. JS666]
MSSAIETIPPAAVPARLVPRLSRWSRTGLLGLAVLVFWLFIAAAGPWILPHGSGDMSTAGVFDAISRTHWLGTDYLGRDILSRVMDGARYTVGVALAATVMACAAGTLLGLLAAVNGGWFDAVLSRLLDTLVSIPSKMLALIIVAAFGSSIPLLIVTVAVVYTPGAYRIARALAVNINAMDYVTVARARGEGRTYIMLREVLPNIAGPLLADMGLRFVYAVLLLASLSFLGLGVQPPVADWGSLVRENIGALPTGGAAVIAPALAIATLTIAVNLVIDNLPGRAQANQESR